MIRNLLLFLSLTGLGWQSYGQASMKLYFDPDGKMAAEADYSFYSDIIPDKKDTTRYQVNTFYRNGNKKAAGAYKAIVFPAGWGNLHRFDFRDALRNGDFEEYDENGQITFRGAYKDGLGEGKHQRWYKSGKLLSEMMLVAGKEEGKVISYYENGEKQLQYESKDGKLHGEAIEYFETGKKKAKSEFSNGQMIGELTRYDSQEKEIPAPEN